MKIMDKVNSHLRVLESVEHKQESFLNQFHNKN